MDISTMNRWEKREMPSPIFLMKIVKSTSVPSQDLYYAMMGMRKSDFDRADVAVKAIGCIRESGMGDLMLQDIDDACDAILHNRMDEEFDSAIKSMANKLAYVGDAIVKAEKEDKDKDKDKDEPKEDKDEDEPKKAEPDSEVVIEEEEPVEEAEVAPEAPAPAPAPAFNMGALFGNAPEAPQVSVDPKLVMKALELLQSIGAMC